MFFEGIRSERQLMDMVNMRLDCRWFIGYDLNEPVPDHSSLSKIRDRYGLEVFQRFFEQIVELCIEAGLVGGEELYFDGTRVRANASMDKVEPRLEIIAKQHLDTLFPDTNLDTQKPEYTPPRRLVDKYNGQRFTSRQTHWYKRTSDSKVSVTDPDATPMKHSNNDRAALGYHTYYVVDGGKSRIILAALVTPASIMDNTPMLDLERWVCFRWQLFPHMAVGDTKYGTVANIVGLEQDGIRAYLPVPDYSNRTGFFSLKHFHYDAQRDLFICPQGQELTLRVRRKSEEIFVYQADASACNGCRLKEQCTTSNTGRQIHRSFFYEYLDRATRYRETEAYKKALRKRQVWVEPLFGEGKQWHGMSRFRLRGLEKANIERENMEKTPHTSGKRRPATYF